MAHLIVPPFTRATAIEKLKFAQKMWNTCDPVQVSKGYTSDCIWRNRGSFVKGTAQIQEFLGKKWEKERNYTLRKELFCVGVAGRQSPSTPASASDPTAEPYFNRIAVQFWYEYQDAHDGMRWKRCYGLEDWTYEEADGGKMRKRMMSGNDVLLGVDGDGVGVPASEREDGVEIEGRWFVGGEGEGEGKEGKGEGSWGGDVSGFEISEKHY